MVYSYKLNMTKILKLDVTAENICKDDISNVKLSFIYRYKLGLASLNIFRSRSAVTLKIQTGT